MGITQALAGLVRLATSVSQLTAKDKQMNIAIIKDGYIQNVAVYNEQPADADGTTYMEVQAALDSGLERAPKTQAQLDREAEHDAWVAQQPLHSQVITCRDAVNNATNAAERQAAMQLMMALLIKVIKYQKIESADVPE